MFLLKPADGARGAHIEAVRACYDDCHRLARRVGEEPEVFHPLSVRGRRGEPSGAWAC